MHEKTIMEFMIDEQRRVSGVTADFAALLHHVRLACNPISFIVGRGARADAHGSAQATNVQGETQKHLDVPANDIFLRTSEYGRQLAAMVSDELEDLYSIPKDYPRGEYLLAFDRLDGSSNIDVNASVGSNFQYCGRPWAPANRPLRTFSSPARHKSVPGIPFTVRPTCCCSH